MGKLIEMVRENFGDSVLGSHEVAGDETIIVTREGFKDLMSWLRDDPNTKLNMLVDVTAVDFFGMKPAAHAQVTPLDDGNPAGLTSDTLPRFEAVYHLHSLALGHRLRVKVPIAEDDAIVPTVSDLWSSANWGEREVYDMIGVRFEGHPDPRRILLYDEFQGHPLRKDYPQRGYQPLVSMPTLERYTDNPELR